MSRRSKHATVTASSSEDYDQQIYGREWQALCASKIPGRTDERKPHAEKEHPFPCPFQLNLSPDSGIREFRDRVSSSFLSDSNGCLSLELIEFVSAQP